MGGKTIDWSEADAVDDAAAGTGSEDVEELGWKKSGNAIRSSAKQDWMDAIYETFKGRAYDPYVWKQQYHPKDPNIQIDYLVDMDGDTWFAIFTYAKGKMVDEVKLSVQQMVDELEGAFPLE
jgi:hypothetical protein